MGYTCYMVCIKEIGWSSSKHMAPIAPLLGVAMYVLAVWMITGDLKQKGQLIWAVASFTVVSAIFVLAIQ